MKSQYNETMKFKATMYTLIVILSVAATFPLFIGLHYALTIIQEITLK